MRENRKNTLTCMTISVVDTWGGPPAGIITGETNSDIGHFDACLNSVFFNEISDSDHEYTMSPVYTLVKASYAKQKIFLGFCLPETCSSRTEIPKLLEDIVISLGMDRSVEVVSVIDSKSVQWTAFEHYTLTFIIVLVTLVLLGSIGVYKIKQLTFLKAFSIVQNSRELFAISDTNKEFEFINGIKVYCFIHVACSHILNTWVDYPRYNAPSSRFFLFVHGHMAADVFFLLSGMLMSYQFMKKQEKG